MLFEEFLTKSMWENFREEENHSESKVETVSVVA